MFSSTPYLEISWDQYLPLLEFKHQTFVSIWYRGPYSKLKFIQLTWFVAPIGSDIRLLMSRGLHSGISSTRNLSQPKF